MINSELWLKFNIQIFNIAYDNNQFYKSCNAGEKQFFVPEEGPLKISCTDDKGRNRDITITVKYVNL